MPLQLTSIPYKDHSYPYYYLCNYLPLSAGKDTLSYSLLKFKRGLQPDLDGWISCSLEMLAPHIPPGRTILRALHHDETTSREEAPTSLDKLGKALAHHLRGHYHPRMLRKSRTTPAIKQLSREQRTAELEGLYSIDPSRSPSSQPSFLIIDDILTTGATMKMIIDALRHTYPHAGLEVFTLARADYDTRGSQPAIPSGQDYPTAQDMDWTVAEELTPAYSLQELKSRITMDIF